MTNLRTVFADVNAVLDLVAKRGEHYLPMAKFMALNRYGQLTIGVAASTFPFAYYELTQRQGFAPAVANRILERFARDVVVVSVDATIVGESFANPIEDLEDAVQYACAEAYGAQLILTRDAEGFEGMPIPSTSPSDLLSA